MEDAANTDDLYRASMEQEVSPIVDSFSTLRLAQIGEMVCAAVAEDTLPLLMWFEMSPEERRLVGKAAIATLMTACQLRKIPQT